MTAKDLAYHLHRGLTERSTGPLKRSHIYELLAAAFGYGSYAAFCADSVFVRLPPSAPATAVDPAALELRCARLGHASSARSTAHWISDRLIAERLAAVRLQDLVDALRTGPEDDWASDEVETDSRSKVNELLDALEDTGEAGLEEFLIDSLDSAAGRSHPLAHYALALLYRDQDVDEDLQPQGSEYWHRQRLAGEALSAAATEWADEYVRQRDREQRARFHLAEAARLGNAHALVDLAELEGDPAFFEEQVDGALIDYPLRVAHIAGELGRDDDQKHWLTVAAQSGNIEALEELIEIHDKDDLERRWKWIYLAQLLGTDFTRDDMHAYHDGGPRADEEYDDDWGGPAYVGGREAVTLDPLPESEDLEVRKQAETLHRAILARRRKPVTDLQGMDNG